MNKQQADKIASELVKIARSISEAVQSAPAGNGAVSDPSRGQPIVPAGAVAGGKAITLDEEALYRRFKARFIDDARTDPILLQLIAAQPEIVVGIEHRTVELDGSTLKGRLAILAARGFFKDGKSQADTNRELGRTGAQAHTGRLSEAFSALVIEGIFTREDSGFRLAPGVKVTEKALQI